MDTPNESNMVDNVMDTSKEPPKKKKKKKEKHLFYTNNIAKQTFLKAMSENGGHIAKSARAAGVSRRVFYDWLKDPEFKSAAEAAEEDFVDDIEEGVRTKCKKGQWPVMKYYLENRRPHRWRNTDAPVMAPLSGEIAVTINRRVLGEGDELSHN
jgi:hypothetical protein